MPPSRRSSSSRSSRSRSSSSRRRSSSSRRRSSSSHSSSYRRSSTRSSSSRPLRSRTNQPRGVPGSIVSSAVFVQCKNHDYIYYKESWSDEATGTYYRKGYYDEDGTYYDGDSIAFKKPDGSYEAHYQCDYCGTEFESNWKEGFYPTCKNCGAEMQKTPVYIDEILEIESSSPTYVAPPIVGKVLLVVLGLSFLTPFIFMIFFLILSFSLERSVSESDKWVQTGDGEYRYVGESETTETNLDIYGTEIYLDEISDNIYRICDEEDDYEKHITWDYGAKSYYDYESDCYLWYNTDVSPNLWQYWYDDIAGDAYYGWMECEGDAWFIEVSDTEWDRYSGDTSELWHIENSFDE